MVRGFTTLLFTLFLCAITFAAPPEKHNTTIHEIVFVGESAFTTEQMLKMIGPRVGDKHDSAIVGKDLTMLLKENIAKGFVISEVTAGFVPKYGRLTYTLYRYKISTVKVTGNTKGMSEKEVSDFLQLKVGEYYNPLRTAALVSELFKKLRPKQIIQGYQTKPKVDTSCICIDISY